MKIILKKQIVQTISFIFILMMFLGCSSYFENPLKDKETGDDINLLILDFNFFNTRMTYKLMDAADGALITVPATVTFTGQNGNDIVSFAGEKNSEFVTTQGQMELTVDPNVAINESSPFVFAVNVEVEGYNKLSKGILFRNEGKKTIELFLTKIEDEIIENVEGEIDFENGEINFYLPPDILKSGSEEVLKPFKINYGITLEDFLKSRKENGELFFSPETTEQQLEDIYNAYPDTFIVMSFSKNNNYKPGVDLVNINGNPVSVLFQILETGSLNQILIMGEKVGDLGGGIISSTCEFTASPVPDIFGFANFVDDNWEIIGTDTTYNSLDFNYTLVGAYETICETGCSITFQSSVISSFSIDADIYDLNDNFLFYVNFKGNFPETFVLENVPEGAVKIVFRDSLASFETISPLIIDNVCDDINKVVNVIPVSGYEEYQIVLKAICPDNLSVAVAPTYSAEVKIKGSDDPWQGIDMGSGVVDLLGLPGKEYQLRLYWENDWEYSTYWTDFDASGNYLHETDAKTEVKSEIMDDGRIRILVDQIFNQNVCNDLGW